MSGLAGIVRWDGAPSSDGQLRRLIGAIAYRGLDGMRVLSGGGTSMIYAYTVTTPEAAHDAQPLDNRRSGIRVTFDGRLDNREELARALGIDGCLAHVPDSELAAAAYEQWGSECPVRLLGDFVLVAWDERRRQLFAARDVMGARPFYYRQDPGAFIWSSEQGALADGTPNDGFLGEVLADRVTTSGETIHRGVMRLPMAHALLVTEARPAALWRYWRPAPDGRIRYRDPRDYEEHFRSVFREAVRARLRLAGGAALMLSGGIDSASIAAEVSALRDKGVDGADRVEAFSLVVPGHPGDEGPVIREVIGRTGLPATCLPLARVREADFIEDAQASLDLPASPDPLQLAASARGLHVVLSGMGGDEWFYGSTGEVADLLRRGRFVRAAGWLRDAARVPNRTRWPSLLRMGAWMTVPDRCKPMVRRLLGRRAVPRWIDRRFAEAIGLEERLREMPGRVEFAAVAVADAFWTATRADAQSRRELCERAAARDGLEPRDPYYDRRIVDFALAIPPEVRAAGGIPKGLVRRAMADRLPPEVTGMPPETDFGFLFVDWLESFGGPARLTSSRPCVRGWVRRETIDPMYRDYSSGLTRFLWPIWAIFSIDVWLHALEVRASATQET